MTQIDLFSQLASLTNECVIGCDFEQDRFLYVSQSDHRLLPASSYASLSESFAQMKAYIHPDDQHWENWRSIVFLIENRNVINKWFWENNSIVCFEVGLNGVF